jgi:hypothetical protein
MITQGVRMYFLYLSIVSVFLVPTICAMDFHQRFVDSQCSGVDLRAVVALADHNNPLPGSEQRTSIRQLFDGQNFSNKFGLYALINGIVVDYSLASCDERRRLLASCVSSLYVLYTENEQENRALFFGTSDINNVRLLLNYLMLKASWIKKPASRSRGNTVTVRDVVACWNDGKIKERAV